MVRIPYIKIPSVRVGSIVPTSNIGTGGATPAPPTPITYLTQWKIVGNSEVHDNEIWSCGEYNATDGKYHIIVQPQGGSVADIALDAPLMKVNNKADTIEFPSYTEGKALVTRNLKEVGMVNLNWGILSSGVSGTYRFKAEVEDAYSYAPNESAYTINTGGYENKYGNSTYYHTSESRMIGMYKVSDGFTYPAFVIYDPNYNQADDLPAFLAYLSDKRMIYRLATPTTELVDAPQIEEADSYSMVISQGAKAVEWSSFTTNSE